MSLRQNALVLILLTGVLGIIGTWTAGPELRHWWALPAALLLSGLAYEAAILGRCVLELELQAPEYWPLARSQTMSYIFRQRSRPILFIQVALFSPEEFACQSRLETLKLLAGIPAVAGLSAAPRRLGRYSWPSPTLRVGGALRLAWWPRVVASD